MRELVAAARLLGLPYLWKLRRGYRAGWEEMFRGYVVSRGMQALLETGFVDRLLERGYERTDEFAADHNLDPQILEALCESLYATRLLEKNGASYRLSRQGKLLIEVLRGWLDVSHGYDEIFSSLGPMLRKEKSYGTDFFRRSDFVAKGSGEMESSLFFPLAIDLIARQGYRKVLDLGCGDGMFLRQLCQARPEVTGYGIDLAADAIEDGRARTREAGLEDRIQLCAGDVRGLRGMPEAWLSVEATTIFFVLHELLWSGERVLIEFLQHFRAALPGVPLIVFEAVRPPVEEMRRKRGIAIYYFLYHDLSHQKPVSRAEWRRLFRAAGFESVEERHLAFARTVICTLR